MSAMQNDTIAAIATPPGQGGIGVIRVSGTEAFAAAMQEVAASSEQQSASTEEIAAAAATLAGAADRLGKLVANLRIDDTPTERPEPPQAGISMRLPPELGVLRPLAN